MANKKYYTGKSKIQGKGAFAKKSLKPGDLIGKVHTINQPYVDYEFTELGRNHNHSENPNVENVLIGNERHLVATKPIKKGQELTTDYRLQPDLEQPENFKKGGKMTPQKDGYRSYSPYKNLPYIEVDSNAIDTNGIVHDLLLVGDDGSQKFVEKNTGVHVLPNSKRVTEYPVKAKAGGWLDAYDAPQAQNGIEGTMGGLTDKGFNYNGAWGGQFQNGGEIDEQAFQNFFKTLPANLRMDTPDYNIRGYWDALGRPSEFDYSQGKQEDGKHHAFSRHPRTGEILKGPQHPTFKMAIEEDRKAGYLPIVTPEGTVKTVNGQFAMGGSLPGSVGFTYARTNSPAPSEGPYAKKTMPSAQEGIVTDPVKPALEDMLQFYESRPEELQIPEMEESLRRLRFKPKSPKFMERYQDGAMGYYNPIGNVIGYNTDPRLIDFEGGVEETLKHEIGHGAYKKLPRSMKKIVRESRIPLREISENLNVDIPFAEYIRDDTEFYTRRRPVFEAFGLDPSAPISKEQAKKLADFSGAMRSIKKKGITPEEAYIQFKNKFPEQLEMLDMLNEYPNRREVMHFMNTIKADPDTFLRMFNDVTAVPGETVPMAQNGRSIGDNTRIPKPTIPTFIQRDRLRETESFEPQDTRSWWSDSRAKERGDDLWNATKKVTAIGQFSPEPISRYASIALNSLMGAADTYFSAKEGDIANAKINAIGAIPLPGYGSIKALKNAPGLNARQKASVVRSGLGALGVDLFGTSADLTNNFGLEKKKNGGMTYYQHGLDWKPKTISRNGGWLDKYTPKAQNGRATTSDSLEVYNNALAIRNYYDKLRKKGWYKNPEIQDLSSIYNRKDDFKKQMEKIKNESLNTYKMLLRKKESDNPIEFKYFKNVYPNASYADFQKAIAKSFVDAKSGKGDKYYYKDLFPSVIDPIAPSTLVNLDILPNEQINFHMKGDRTNLKNTPPGGSVTGIYTYNPLSVKPYHMRTPQEKLEWEKKYGKKTSSNEKTKPKDKPGEWKPLKPFTGVIENSKPKSKPEPKLKKKVSQVSKLPMGEPSQGIGITERQFPNIPAPNVEMSGPYMVSYHDYGTQEGIDRGFRTAEERDAFVKELENRQAGNYQPSQMGISSYYDVNKKQTKKVNQKRNGSWLDGYK